jgi:acyl carrier protein
MTPAEIRDRVLQELVTIAPEADPAAIAPTVPLRDQLDIDSFDFLNLVIALNRSLGVEIPESDYGQLVTLNGAVAYLAARLGRH